MLFSMMNGNVFGLQGVLMAYHEYDGGASEHLRGLVVIVDRLLPPDEANALTHYHDFILRYVDMALDQGLSSLEIQPDLEDVQDLWGFGPWAVLFEEGCMFVIANASANLNSETHGL